MKEKKMQIRNSTADFLVFTKDSGSDSIEVRVQDHEVWLTQKSLGQLFDVDRSVITKHLKNVFQEGELDETTTCANFAQVADNGRTYHYKFYSLPAIIAVGYRINSTRATQFRQWATKVLDTFTRQGYVLDKDRLINGQIFDEDYFEHLISEIQEIRASERRFYQKITDIYATAVDYSVDSKTTKDFFATVQNKMHYAIHGNTAAEVIMARADHTKEHMGLTTWKNAPDGKIVKADVSIAKNYLSSDELHELNEIVTMYLDYATRQARRHIPMTMADWSSKLDAFLQFNDAEILHDKGKVTAAIAKAFDCLPESAGCRNDLPRTGTRLCTFSAVSGIHQEQCGIRSMASGLSGCERSIAFYRFQFPLWADRLWSVGPSCCKFSSGSLCRHFRCIHESRWCCYRLCRPER